MRPTSAPSILFFDMIPGNPSQMLKLAGIRRYAALRGWEVVCVPRDWERPLDVGALLATHHPIGVVVEGSGRRIAYPPRLFGPVPVAYIEYPAAEVSGCAPNVIVDDDAIAMVAFRELSQGAPRAYAVVGHRNPHLWSRLRASAFRRRCDMECVRCIAFPAKRNESSDSYDTRLAEWIAALPPKTAIFTTGDTIAVAASHAARVAMRHIPKDLTLCSACDIPEICESATPPATSIPLDFERMGFVAARALGEMIGTSGTSGTSAKKKGARPSCPSCPRNTLSIGPLLVSRRKSTSGRGRHEPWVLKAAEIIRAEACEGLSIAELLPRLRTAKGKPVSRTNFDRRFREAMGHSALDEIQQVRLEAACALLAQTDTPVMAVADFCGFGCYRALDAVFRSRFKMSMRKWRERNAR